jgi:hypothetical protein
MPSSSSKHIAMDMVLSYGIFSATSFPVLGPKAEQSTAKVVQHLPPWFVFHQISCGASFSLMMSSEACAFDPVPDCNMASLDNLQNDNDLAPFPNDGPAKYKYSTWPHTLMTFRFFMTHVWETGHLQAMSF